METAGTNHKIESAFESLPESPAVRLAQMLFDELSSPEGYQKVKKSLHFFLMSKSATSEAASAVAVPVSTLPPAGPFHESVVGAPSTSLLPKVSMKTQRMPDGSMEIQCDTTKGRDFALRLLIDEWGDLNAESQARFSTPAPTGANSIIINGEVDQCLQIIQRYKKNFIMLSAGGEHGLFA